MIGKELDLDNNINRICNLIAGRVVHDAYMSINAKKVTKDIILFLCENNRLRKYCFH